MKPKTMIMMGVAVVLGLAASWMTTQLYSKSKETIQVLRAKEPIPKHTMLYNPQDKFILAEINKSDAPPNVVTDETAGQAVRRRTRKALEPGDMLTLDDLFEKGKGGLEDELPKGKRAIAIPITQASAAGGFVMAGSRVDVIHTPREGSKTGPAAVLQNVKVLAIDQSSSRPEDKAALVGATATLELGPEQVLELARVQGSGSLMLSLRPPEDDSVAAGSKDTEYTPLDVAPPPALIPDEKPVVPDKKDDKKPEAKPPEPQKVMMTIVSGSGWSQTTYKVNDRGDIVDSEAKQGTRADMPKSDVKPDAKPDTKPPAVDTNTKKPDDQASY